MHSSTDKRPDDDLISQTLSFDPVLVPEEEPQPVRIREIRDGTGEPALEVTLQIRAPHARRVEMLVHHEYFPFHPTSSGIWEAPFPWRDAYTRVQLIVDGMEILSPYLPITWAHGRPCNFVSLPAADDAAWRLQDIPHGTVHEEKFFSSVTRRTHACVVYTPPGYEQEQDRAYPVLYLQHGWGENEQSWLCAGRADRILDALIHEGNCVPMIVVMLAGMVQTGERGADGRLLYDHTLFPRQLLTDVLPLIRRHYRIREGRENTAIAGLSMGSMQACRTAFTHPECFGSVGLFSGFLHDFIEGNPQMDDIDRPPATDAHLAFLERPDAGEVFSVFFRAIGDRDDYLEHFLADDALLAEHPIPQIRRIYSGIHDWNVWRECLRDFLPLLFRSEADDGQTATQKEKRGTEDRSGEV